MMRTMRIMMMIYAIASCRHAHGAQLIKFLQALAIVLDASVSFFTQ
jgi:hypothetical protein